MLKNLKLKISISIFGLVLIGMLTIALVVFVFLLNSNTKLEVSHFQNLLNLEKDKLGGKQSGCQQYFVTNESKELLNRDDVGCLSVLRDGLFCGVPNDCTNNKNIQNILLKAGDSNKDLIEMKGSLWERFFEGQSFTIASPIVNEGESVGALALSGNLQGGYFSAKDNIEITFVYIFVNAIILSEVGFYRMAKIVIRPLEQLVQLADSYDDDVIADNLFRRNENEFGQLAFRLKQMMKRIEHDNHTLRSTVDSLKTSNEELKRARIEVVRAEKLASVGRLSAGLAHEVGNPLGIVKGYLDMLEHDNVSASDCREFAARAGAEVARMESIINQLLDCSRQSKIDRKPINLDEILEDLVLMFRNRKFASRIEFMVQNLTPDISVNANYDSLRQVFLNCLLNSIDAIEEKNGLNVGEISITTSLGQKDGGSKYVIIDITDNGMGVDSEQLENVFDPFFTTKEPGKGTGLGLAVSYTLVEQFGGEMSLHNNISGGARVRIELPYSESKN